MKQPTLETQRLVLVPFTVEDGQAIQSLAGNYEVAKSTLGIPHPYPDGIAESWIDSRLDAWQSQQGVSFAIRLRSTNELMGDVSLVEMKQCKAEIGYWIGEPYWGQGYCTEAAQALVDFATRELGITHIIAEHLASNPASGKVMRKIGMTHLRTAPLPDRDGELVDCEIYELFGTGSPNCDSHFIHP